MVGFGVVIRVVRVAAQARVMEGRGRQTLILWQDRVLLLRCPVHIVLID